MPNQPSSRITWRSSITLISLFAFIAFFLRIFDLSKQSLWYDEAFSVYLAHFDLATITARTAADIQPPLYYYLLNVWMTLAGDSEFAVRFLSLFFGVLTIPLMYITARRLFNSTAALFAVILATFSALYLWYSQEARMYTLITFLGLLSSYALLRALSPSPLVGRGGTYSDADVARQSVAGARHGHEGRWWIVFVVANVAAVYTHYFAFTLLAFQFLYAFLVLLRGSKALGNPRSALCNTLLAFAAILIAFLPWIPFMLNRLGEDASYFRGELKLDEAVRHIVINFSVGESVLENIAQYIAPGWLVVLVVVMIGYLISRSRTDQPTNRPTNGLLFSFLYLVVPLALLLFLFSRNPKFNARYLMLASPGFFLLLAAGLASLLAFVRSKNILARVSSAVALLLAFSFLLLTSLYSITNAYFDPAFTKADFRGVANFISANAQDDEAIILTSGHLFPAFDYYYRGAGRTRNLPELRLPDEATLNADNVLNFDAANEVNRGLNGKRGVWLVLWQDEVADPNGVVPMLLASRGVEQKQDAAFWQVRLRHWRFENGFTPLAATPEIRNRTEANFQNTFQLLGWDQPNPISADQGASLRLFWKSLQTADTSSPNTRRTGSVGDGVSPDDYNVAIRIVDNNGTFWGKVDRRPAGFNYPTMRWKQNEIVAGDYVAQLLPGTPAGEYFATVTLFTKQNEMGLDVLAPNGAPLGKSVRVGPLQILPAQKQPTLADLKIQHSLSTPLAPFTLLGYQIGAEKSSTGDSIPLTLFWRADEKPNAEYSFQIQFGDKFSVPQPLANANDPTTQWSAGEIVRGQYVIQIPPDGNAWSGNLALKLVGGNQERAADLQQPFVVEKTDRNFSAPAPQVSQSANFNNVIELVGYDISARETKAGQPLQVTLYWKAMGKMEKNYTVFVQLLGAAPPPVAQKDSQPLNGGRPTQTWVAGEYLADPYTLELKPDVPPGEYKILIGWYDASDPSFARLQVLGANGNAAGDFVTLKDQVTVK